MEYIAFTAEKKPGKVQIQQQMLITLIMKLNLVKKLMKKESILI